MAKTRGRWLSTAMRVEAGFSEELGLFFSTFGIGLSGFHGCDILLIDEGRSSRMTRIRWRDRVVISPDIDHGDPCIAGTRVPAAMIVRSLADGMTPEDILEAYPQLTREDVQAALAYTDD